MTAVTICSDSGAQENKSLTVSIVSPSICQQVMGLDAMILVFWMLSFKPAFSLYCFTFIKRFFSSSSLSAIRVVSSAYLRLLIFLSEILIPACVSSSLGFCMMYYSACICFCFIDYAKAFDCVDHNKLWKILKEMGIPDHLTCLLRNLYVGQEATVRTGHGTTDWFQIKKGIQQGYILSPCLFNLYA